MELGFQKVEPPKERHPNHFGLTPSGAEVSIHYHRTEALIDDNRSPLRTVLGDQPEEEAVLN